MKARVFWQFLGPHLTLFAVFLALPLMAIFVLSAFDWNLLGGHRYIGFENYRELLADRAFWRALGNTLLFAAAIVPGSVITGLAAALALNRSLPWQRTLRTAIFLPFVISGVASGVIGGWLLNDHYGVFNLALQSVGLPPIPWLSSTAFAMPSVMLTNLWLRTGLCMIIYLAALQDIPKDQLEAASLDGANTWNRFRHIVWPVLMPSTVFLLVTNLIFSLQVFDVIYVMTEGGPAGSTTVLVQYLYSQAFDQQRQGYGSAIGVVLLFVLLPLTLLLLRRDPDAAA